MGKFIVNGGQSIARMHIQNISSTDEYDKYADNIALLGTSPDKWQDSSILLANITNPTTKEGTLSGNGSDYQFNGIKKFVIYKTIGKANDKLYKVYETSSGTEKWCEDYIVGDMCEYKYYVYPILKGEEGFETINQPFETEPIRLDSGKLTVINLIQDGNIYRVDTDNIWKFGANVSDGGSTLNTNKNFVDTLNSYQQEGGATRAYKTKSVTALIGDMDCSTREFVDTYEMLEAWDKFCASSSLKVLIDLRGRIFLGDIDNNPSTSYDTTSYQREATVNFSFRELDSIDNVIILNSKTSNIAMEAKYEHS